MLYPSIFQNKIKGIMAASLFSAPFAKNKAWYSLYADGGLMTSIVNEKNASEQYLQAKRDNYGLYLLMMAWDMFDLGVFVANIQLKSKKPICDIPSEILEEELSAYFNGPYLETTCNTIGIEASEKNIEELTGIIRHYVGQVCEQYPEELRSEEHLICFLETAYDGGTTLVNNRTRKRKTLSQIRWVYKVTC